MKYEIVNDDTCKMGNKDVLCCSQMKSYLAPAGTLYVMMRRYYKKLNVWDRDDRLHRKEAEKQFVGNLRSQLWEIREAVCGKSEKPIVGNLSLGLPRCHCLNCPSFTASLPFSRLPESPDLEFGDKLRSYIFLSAICLKFGHSPASGWRKQG